MAQAQQTAKLPRATPAVANAPVPIEGIPGNLWAEVIGPERGSDLVPGRDHGHKSTPEPIAIADRHGGSHSARRYKFPVNLLLVNLW